MQTQAARHTLKFQILPSRECRPVSGLPAPPLPALLAVLHSASDHFLCILTPLCLPFTQNKEVVTSALRLNLGSGSRICLQAASSSSDPSCTWPGHGHHRWSPCLQCTGVKREKEKKSHGCAGSVLSQSRCSRVGSTNPDVTMLSKTSLGWSV